MEKGVGGKREGTRHHKVESSRFVCGSLARILNAVVPREICDRDEQ
jgi:hypothetical protein